MIKKFLFLSMVFCCCLKSGEALKGTLNSTPQITSAGVIAYINASLSSPMNTTPPSVATLLPLLNTYEVKNTKLANQAYERLLREYSGQQSMESFDIDLLTTTIKDAQKAILSQAHTPSFGDIQGTLHAFVPYVKSYYEARGRIMSGCLQKRGHGSLDACDMICQQFQPLENSFFIAQILGDDILREAGFTTALSTAEVHQYVMKGCPHQTDKVTTACGRAAMSLSVYNRIAAARGFKALLSEVEKTPSLPKDVRARLKKFPIEKFLEALDIIITSIKDPRAPGAVPFKAAPDFLNPYYAALPLDVHHAILTIRHACIQNSSCFSKDAYSKEMLDFLERLKPLHDAVAALQVLGGDIPTYCTKAAA